MNFNMITIIDIIEWSGESNSRGMVNILVITFSLESLAIGAPRLIDNIGGQVRYHSLLTPFDC